MDWKEKRKYPRFRAADKALAADKDNPYTLMNLSSRGLGMKLYGEQPVWAEITIDLFFLNRELTLKGVHCRKVFERKLQPDPPERSLNGM